MASSSKPPKVVGVTVAARVSAFQNAEKLEVNLPKAAEPGVTTGRGRRTDFDFGSPAGRASRDGNEGVKGDGRPPVNDKMFELHQSMKETESYQQKLSRSSSRPGTSLDDTGTARLRRKLRPHRSLEDVVSHSDSANEFFAAKSRLKPVAYTQKSLQKTSREDQVDHLGTVRRQKTNSTVLEELDELLDNAIGEHTTQFTTTDSNETEEATQRSSLALSKFSPINTPSRGTSRYSITAKRRRQSRPRDYPTESSDAHDAQRASPMFKGKLGELNDMTSSTNTETDQEKECVVLLGVQHEPHRTDIPKQFHDSRSPIKARAALFEKISQHEGDLVHEIPQIHDTRKPLRFKESWPPKTKEKDTATKQTTFGESLQKHHRRFHHGVGEPSVTDNADSPPRSGLHEKVRTAHVPPIPLALPQLVSPRRRSTVSTVASRFPPVTASPLQTQAKSMSIIVPSSYETAEENHPEPERKASLSWPFKWELFGKSPAASVKQSRVAAQAESDHHTSPKKTHENQHRVHDLLTAAQHARKLSAGETEHHRSLANVTGQHRDNEDNNDGHRKSSLLKNMPGMLPGTPRYSSAHEKEVAALEEEAPIKFETPTKTTTPGQNATPRTPVRGRKRIQGVEVVEAFSEANSSPVFAKEQRFTLSRSRSRGGGAVRVQVEVRTPRASPERNSGAGDHVIVVSAQVDPIDEADEGEEGDGL